MRGWIIILGLCIIPFYAFTQMNSLNEGISEDYIGIGVSAGITSFFGDIDEGVAEGSFISNNSAFGLRLSKDFGSIFALGGEVTLGSLSGSKKRGSGSDSYYKYFQTRFIEYNLSTQYNLMGLISDNVNRKLNIYATIGIGLIDFRSKLYNGYNDSVEVSLGYYGEKTTTELAIPVGLKFVYHISDKSSIVFETTSRRVDSDKLDAVEGNNNRDYYNFTAIGYIYKFYPDRRNPNIKLAKAEKRKKKKAVRKKKALAKKQSRKEFKLKRKKTKTASGGKKDKKTKKKKSYREK